MTFYTLRIPYIRDVIACATFRMIEYRFIVYYVQKLVREWIFQVNIVENEARCFGSKGSSLFAKGQINHHAKSWHKNEIAWHENVVIHPVHDHINQQPQHTIHH